jgi:hypothetical protein
MIYQLYSHGWPLNGGATFLPVGTRIDIDQPEWAWLASLVPPPNAQALDQEAYDLMAANYPYNIILTGPGIDRHQDR